MRDLRAPRARDITGFAQLFGIDDVLIAAGISAAGSLLGGAKASSASKSAAAASQYAADQTAAVQREATQLAQQNTATSRGAGNLSTNALAARFGLIPNGSAVGGNIYAAGTGAQTPSASQSGNIYGSAVPYSATQQAGQPDWNAVLAARPDVAAAVADPNGGFNGATAQERAADWYARYGQQSGYQVPTISAPQAQAAAPVTDVQLSPSAQMPTYTRPDAMQAPATYVPNIYQPGGGSRPTYGGTLDVSYDSYLDSPEAMAADYDISQQSGAASSALAASGASKSGAALKALQNIGQSNKVKYYGDFRNYNTNQFNTDRARFDNNYNFDAQLSQQDRQFGATFNQANYQYGQNRADNIFNLDRAYGTDLALGNRAYETSRYDNMTGNLFNLANLGQGAAAQSNNAAANYANATSQNLFSNAANQGNAALTSASQFNQLLGQGIGALTYALGNRSNTTPKV